MRYAVCAICGQRWPEFPESAREAHVEEHLDRGEGPEDVVELRRAAKEAFVTYMKEAMT